MKFVQVMFCCNDPRNGNDTGRVDVVHVLADPDGVAIELEGPLKVFRQESRDWIRLGRRRHRILGRGHWVGNWCWDSVSVMPDVAAQIVNQLVIDGAWQCTAAESAIFKKLQHGMRLQAADLVGATAG